MKNIQDCLPDDTIFDILVTHLISELKELVDSNVNNDLKRISQRKFLIAELISLKIKTIENDFDELIKILRIQKDDYYIKESILTGFFEAVLSLVVKKTKCPENSNPTVKESPLQESMCEIIKVEPIEPSSYPFNLEDEFECAIGHFEQTNNEFEQVNDTTNESDETVNVFQEQAITSFSNQNVSNEQIEITSNRPVNILPVILRNKQASKNDSNLELKIESEDLNKNQSNKSNENETSKSNITNNTLISKKANEKSKKIPSSSSVNRNVDNLPNEVSKG